MSRRRRKKRIKRLSTRKMYTKVAFVLGALVLLAFVVVIRLIQLNVSKGHVYSKKVLAQQSYVSNVIPFRRGDITDRNGNILAVSKKVYNLVMDPMQILSDEKKYKKPTYDALSDVLGLKKNTFENILKKNPESRYYVVKKFKGLTSEIVKKFEKLQEDDENIKGVWFEEDYVRTYPYSTVGSTVLGFAGADNTGSGGVESFYNSYLNGTPGKSFGYYDQDLNLIKSVKEPVNGNKIISTLDVNVQGLVEQHMAAFQSQTGSDNMGVIVMNPGSGEIYAMASSPGFDLNNPADLSAKFSAEEIQNMSEKKKNEELNKLWRNFCISDSFEPGSTFKPITVAACMDEGAASAKRTYVCDGGQKIGNAYIKCTAYSKGGHGNLDLCGALMESCNDVLMQISSKLGGDTFVNYVSLFGFGRRTGIDIPGEATGTVFTPDKMGVTELATSSFGQGQTVTMIQLASAFCSVINGGNYYQPHLVSSIQTQGGANVKNFDDTLIRKTVTEKNSKKIRKYLLETVENGTAKAAKVEGYKIGGKTGTAEKIPRDKKNYLVSFIGFAPADNPQVVVYVVIDKPHVEDQAHSTYATEFASSLMKDIFPFLGVFKSGDSGDSSADANIHLPSSINGNSFEETAPDGGVSNKNYNVAQTGENGESGEETGVARTEADNEAESQPDESGEDTEDETEVSEQGEETQKPDDEAEGETISE